MKLKRVKLSTLRDTAVQASIDDDEESAISTSEKDVDHSRKRSHLSTEESSESKDKRKKKQVQDSTSKVIEDSKGGKGNPTETVKKSIKSDNLISKVPTDKKAESDNTGIDELCNDKTIYIEGLPYDSTDADVSLFFESCGEIKSIRLPKWHDSDRLRGYGHVQFSSIESVKEALTLDGCDLKGRYIKVDKPQTPRALSSALASKGNILRPPGCRSVFVKNIPYDTTEAEITEVFKVCGPVTSVRLAVWGNTKQLKGFGYVDFKREDSAEIAVKKSGILTLKSRPVVVDFETGAPKKSFRQPDGKIWTKKGSFTGKK